MVLRMYLGAEENLGDVFSRKFFFLLVQSCRGDIFTELVIFFVLGG